MILNKIEEDYDIDKNDYIIEHDDIDDDDDIGEEDIDEDDHIKEMMTFVNDEDVVFILNMDD